MKIAVTSDVHLEFGDWYPSNPENADVLILGGDIMVASDLYGTHKTERFLEFLDNCKKEYREVIYIMGNHEHYNGDFSESHKLLRDACDERSIHFLDKETVEIDNVVFIGGTLWTDMNGEDPMTILAVKDMMNDFRCVRNSNRTVYREVPVYEYDENGKVKLDANGYVIKTGTKQEGYPAKFSPDDAVEDHKKFIQYLEIVLAGRGPNKKYVVVGHHAPSRQSTHPRYKDDYLLNGAYSSSLDLFIEDHPEIVLWTHGHTHEPFDYVIGETRIVCNPRGYVNHERRSDKDEPYLAKVIEV
jgi:Icc-related predicted phosphoesterase